MDFQSVVPQKASCPRPLVPHEYAGSGNNSRTNGRDRAVSRVCLQVDSIRKLGKFDTFIDLEES
jgi:hypothetical protein